MNKKDFDIITVDKWKDKPDIPEYVLTMPNVPKPLHGGGHQPRTILTSREWNLMRNTCYRQADDTCEACGYKPEDKRHRHAHEVYDIDYKNQTATFKRCVCLCYRCHIMAIHTGRALTMYKHHNPMFTKENLLEGAEHAFTIISSYNKAHPEQEPLRLYDTWLEYMKQPELKMPMEKLIKKYDIKFYRIKKGLEGGKNWSNWKLVIGDNEYPTKFKDYEDWERAMRENNKRQYGTAKGRGRPVFTKEVYKEVDKILEKGD